MPSSLHSPAMSKSMTCLQFPPFRQKLCWVRWGHSCKEWRLKKKTIFQEQGDIFSTDIKTENCPELTRSPLELPPADWWEQLWGSWMGTRLCRLYSRGGCCYLQQTPLSLSRVVLPQLHQRCYTSGNNSHMLGDHVVLQWTDFRKATTACLEVHSH